MWMWRSRQTRGSARLRMRPNEFGALRGSPPRLRWAFFMRYRKRGSRCGSRPLAVRGFWNYPAYLRESCRLAIYCSGQSTARPRPCHRQGSFSMRPDVRKAGPTQWDGLSSSRFPKLQFYKTDRWGFRSRHINSQTLSIRSVTARRNLDVSNSLRRLPSRLHLPML